MQSGRHLLRKVHMTPSVYFTHAEKTMPSEQSVLIILKENQAQSKVKNNYSLYRYKRQGHFYLESTFFSSSVSIQTPVLSRYTQILIFLQINFILDIWSPN